MNAAETIQAAIDKLEGLKADTSPAPWFATEDTLYTAETWKGPRGRIAPRPIFMAEGNWVAGYVYIEADAELILALHRTIDAQLAILRHEADRLASRYRTPAAIQQFTVRTDMDVTWFEIPERAAFEMGLPLRQGGIRHPNPVYLEAELNAAGVKTREAVPAEAKIVDLARAILGEDGQSVDATRLGVPAATASETGFDLELGEDGQ